MKCSLLALSQKMLHPRLFPLARLLLFIITTVPVFAQNVTEEWARRYNSEGSGDEFFQASVADAEGNLYLTSTSFTAPAFRFGASQQHGVILTVKYSPSGELLWASRFAADSTLDVYGYKDEARAITVDASGGVYVAAIRQAETNLNQTAILFKLNAVDGSQSWSVAYPDGVKEINALAVDRASGVYLTGSIVTGVSTTSCLTIKYSSENGVRLWEKQYGGTAGEGNSAFAVGVDNRGGVVVTGKSYHSYIPSRGVGRVVYDIVTIKYDADDGEERWVSTYTGDTIPDIGPFRVPQKVVLSIDEGGEVYVSGQLGGEGKVATIKYGNQDGKRVWAALRRNSGLRVDPSMVLDGSGGVYVAGAQQAENNYNNRLFLVKYNASNGAQLWQNTYSGATENNFSAPLVATGDADDVFLTSTSSKDGVSKGFVTVRYSTTTGTQLWDKFYTASLSNIGYYRGLVFIEDRVSLIVDSAGNPYVMGSAYTKARENSDLFIIRYNDADGSPAFEKRHDAVASTHDYVRASVVDAEGNSYLAGNSLSNGSESDGIIVKYSSKGEKLWARTYGGGTADWLSGIVLDGAGGVYVTGSTGNQNTDFLTLKLAISDGSVVWEALYDSGFDGYDAAHAIAVDGLGGVYVTGMSYGSTTSSDYATMKYNASDGKQVWVKRFNSGNNKSDHANAIQVDRTGGVYVTGSAEFTNMKHGGDFATIKYNATDGEQLWMARYDGGEGYDAAIALTLDDANGIYVAGRSIGKDNQDVFATVKYDASEGKQLWVSTYGSEGKSNHVNAIAADNRGGVYVTGYGYSSLPEQGLLAEYVTVKYKASDGEQAWVQAYGEALSDSRANAIALDSSGGVYVTGHHRTHDTNGYKGAAVTIKYNGADGAVLWKVRKEGKEEEGATVGLDQAGNVYVAGFSNSNLTYGDLLLVKYTQTAPCVPVTEQAISGPSLVRVGSSTTSSVYSLRGTGASVFDWHVGGDYRVSINGQGTEEIEVYWPTEAGFYEVDVLYSRGELCPEYSERLKVGLYDPDAGYVLGAGWYESPVNPALPGMQTGGKAYFAFASWYGDDATTVYGYTAFRFSAGGLTFQSAAHTPMRLVVYRDNQANYIGTGSVNGKEGYGFMVSVRDGDLLASPEADRLRLKVWEIATGTVVYDTQAGEDEVAFPATAIGAGQIVIYRPIGLSRTEVAAAAAAASRELAPLEPQSLETYPTVFAGKATVSFTSERDEEYALEVFDLSGVSVKKIGSGVAQAGKRQELTFDSKGLADGLYLVRLVSGKQVQTAKIVIRR